MNIFKNTLIAFSFTLISCASYQNGHEAKIETNYNTTISSEDILVTADTNDEYSTDYFSYIQVEFGNQTDKWKDVKKVLLNVKGNELKIVLGQRLNDWSKSIQNKVDVDRQNLDMTLGLVTALAAAAAISSAKSDNTQSTKAYLNVMAGTAIASEVNSLSDKISDIERTKIFPDSHLYSPFSLPPGLVNKRWILVQHSKDVMIDKLSFDIFFKNDKKRTYIVSLNTWKN